MLCAEDGSAIGTAAKSEVHTTRTPLHLAFSCYVFDSAARVLVTRRAFGKRTFPGVRTNSCCGHPEPGEAMVHAVTRRVGQELGLRLGDVDLILPRFRYRAVAEDGTVENELCPVYRAVVTAPVLAPDPAEVADAWWVPWAEFAESDSTDDPLSLWSRRQLGELAALGDDPLRWPVGADSALPAAARLVAQTPAQTYPIGT